jgi:hypothetical protein
MGHEALSGAIFRSDIRIPMAAVFVRNLEFNSPSLSSNRDMLPTFHTCSHFAARTG